MIDTQAIRNKILDLAIQGLLTERLSEDGTGEELLAKITAGKLGGKKTHMPVSSSPPFDLPDGWAWVPLETLGADVPCTFADGPFGSNLKKEHYTTERQVRIIQLSNVGVDGWRNNNEKYTTYEHLETIKRSEVKAGNIVIAKMMPAGRAIVVPEGIADTFVLSSDCIKFVPDPMLDVNYLCYAINSKWFHDQVMNDVHGIGRERTSLSNLKRYFIPIPSVSEQQRIVAIIKKAFSALDTIDALQAKYADNLTVLKSKLIDAAIQGKLTEQLPEDGTAEELYQQIQAEKQSLIKAGKIKKEKPLSEITADEIPFEIPITWKWVRLSDISKKITDGTHNSPINTKDGEFMYVTAKNIKDEGVVLDDITYVTKSVHKVIFSRCNPEMGDVLLIKDGATTGIVTVNNVSEPFSMLSSVALIKPMQFIDPWYVVYVMRSSWFYRYIRNEMTGVGITRVILRQIQTFTIPLPPLAELHRIVQFLCNLLQLCNSNNCF